MRIVISYFVPLLFILGLCLSNSIIFKEKFERVIAFSLIECILITYVFGFIDLRIGLVLVIGLAVASVPLYYWAKRSNCYDIKGMCLTEMLGAFLILYTILFALNIGKTFSKWDEFSHWGMMAKEMFRLDKYYYVDESVLVYHREYPPFTAVFQYIWCKLCGEYKERHLYNAKTILSLAAFFPVYSYFLGRLQNKKNMISKVGNMLFVTAFCLLASKIATIGEAFYYTTIYTEGVLCALIFYAFYSLIFPRKNTVFYSLNVGFAISAIVLTKQLGIYFGVLIIVALVLLLVVQRKVDLKKREVILMIFLPMILWLGWQITTKTMAPAGQFDASRFSVTSIVEIFEGVAPQYRYETIEAFLDALISRTLLYRPWKISYIGFLFIFLLLLRICIKLVEDQSERKNIAVLGGILELTAVGYIPVMLVLYLFGFSEAESVNLACYERYMITVLYPMLLFMLFAFFSILIQKYQSYRKWVCAGFLVGVFLFIPFSNLKEDLTPGIFGDDVASLYQTDAEIIMQNTEETESIYLVSQGDFGSSRNIIAYLTSPREISDRFYSVSEEDKYEVIEYIKEFDYVYLSNIDSVFADNYSEFFGENFINKNQQLYKVIITDDLLSFELIE